VITPLRKIFLFGFAAFLGAHVHAQGTVIATDNFNRANESPIVITGNWGRTIAGGYDGNSVLVNNQVRSSVGEGIYYWKGAGTFDPTRQYAKETIVQKDGEAGLVLLGGPDHAIMLNWGPPGEGHTVYVYWYAGGENRGVLTTAPSSLANGDVVEAVLEGGIIYAKVNGVTVASVANTTTITSGTPGFITFQDVFLPDKIAILDNWEAGTPQSYSISGTITEGGVGLSGATVTASGGAGGGATTNGSGNYTITGVPPGATSIVLTPSKPGHTMSPLTRTVTGPVNANVTGQNFTSTLNTTATLTVNATHGTVTKNPNQTTFPLGAQVTLTPAPDPGYVFNGWSGDVPAGDTSDNPLVLTMDQDRNVTASFVTQTYTISGTITKNAAGLSGVTVTASGGFSGATTTNVNGAYTLANVPSGSVNILLTPTISGHTMSPTTRTVAGPVLANVTAQDFTATPSSSATLTVFAAHGTVSRNPDLPTYPFGTQVTLTPSADGGYSFSSWSGDVPPGHASDNPLVLTMDQDRVVTANFVAPGSVAADYFDRPDEIPFTLDINWLQCFTYGEANLTNQRVAGVWGDSLYYWFGAGTFDNARQFSRVRVMSAAGQVGLVLLAEYQQAIVVAWNEGRLYIYSYKDGVHQGELANEPSAIFDGDVIEAVLDAGTISAKINGVVVKTVAKPANITSGRPGFETFGSGGVLDDWESGIPPLPCSGEPDEISPLQFQSKTPTVLAWPAAIGDSYDVVSSTLADLRANGTATSSCLSNDGATATFQDPRANPAAGQGFYYLVRGQSACGAGTYGYASNGSERIPLAACP